MSDERVAGTAIGRRDASDWDEKKEQYEFFEEYFRLDADTAHGRIREEILRAKRDSEIRNGSVHVQIGYDDMVQMLEEWDARDEEVRRLKEELSEVRQNYYEVVEQRNALVSDNKRLREALEDLANLALADLIPLPSQVEKAFEALKASLPDGMKG